MYRALLLTVLITLILPACRSRQDADVSDSAAYTVTGASADTTFSVWLIDATYKGGPRVRQEQVAVRTWKDGKVVREQFFHA